MKLFSIAYTIIILMALQLCDTQPISLTGSLLENAKRGISLLYRRASIRTPSQESVPSTILDPQFLVARSPDSPVTETITASIINPSFTATSFTSVELPTSTGSATSTAFPSSIPLVLHTIQPGDTLSAIAAAFGVTVSALELSNPDAVPTDLQIGAELVIPTTI